METLYLHCGYHKTGSSFLQTLFARNRELLEKKSIYYPFSDDELDMLRGKISPGNGLELSKALTSVDKDLIYSILGQGIKEALKKDCDAVFYSSELFFHAFAKEQTLSKLCEATNKLGFKNIEALVYFRDPVSHALSTYKHRAKKGDHADFESWITDNYETMGLLSKFNEYHSDYPITWSCRKYKVDSMFMAESAFSDWLGIEIPDIPTEDKVNASLSLSEIRLIQILKDDFPDTIPFIYRELVELSKSYKSNNVDLNRAYYSVATHILVKYRNLINLINGLLPADESLELAEVSEAKFNDLKDLEIALTDKQIEGLATAFSKANEAKKISKSVVVLWDKGINKIKRNLRAAGF